LCIEPPKQNDPESQSSQAADAGREYVPGLHKTHSSTVELPIKEEKVPLGQAIINEPLGQKNPGLH